ncbi:MAG: FtsX-like permease family protein [Deltaproteobacteria bacterium]|nr:FtsX-like permease family protein [Deltaproteobacteria bacterium]
MPTLLRLAVRNLLQHKRRTMLLGAAIATVTVLLILLLSLLTGMRATMLRTATTLMTGHVNVAGFYKITSGSAAPLVTKYPALLDVVKKSTPTLTQVTTRVRGFGKIIADEASIHGVLSGILINEEPAFREVVELTQGKIDQMAEPHALMLFEQQAKRLGVKVGDSVTLSASTFRGVNNTVDLHVVAVAKDLGFLSSFNVFVHADSIRELYELDKNATGVIQVMIKNPDEAEKVAAELRKAIGDAGYRMMDPLAQPFFRKFEPVKREDWTGQKIDVTTWSDEAAFMRYTLDTVQVLTLVVVTVLVIIIIVGVMNTLWMAIRERTKEIGTLRAIGMGKGYVLAMFVTEMAVLAFSATGLGALLALALAAAINAAHVGVSASFAVFLMSPTLVLATDFVIALRSLLAIAVVTTLGALFPAWRATKLQPVTAMHAS